MITCVFGLPGSGKSTLMAKMCQKALKSKKYKKVYSNFSVSGAYPIDFKDLGKYEFIDCLILIDEAMNEADSRDFKKFTPELKYFFSNHRHYGVDIVYFTQAWDDVDKKIRNNTAKLYYMRRVMFWSFTIPIYRKIMINDMTSEIVNGYKMGSILSSRWTFRPRWYRYFDTMERKSLPPLEPRHFVPYPGPRSRHKWSPRFPVHFLHPS